MVYSTDLLERTIKALLRAKREARGNDELTKELNTLQRRYERMYGEYGVVLCDEYSPTRYKIEGH